MVVPDLDLFLENGTTRQVKLVDKNGLESVGYEFVLDLTAIGKGDHWKYYRPDHGFEGVYRLFVNASAGGVPLNVTFLGHNPFLVQAHKDEYHVIYKSFLLRAEGIDIYQFMPPQGMYCQDYANPSGPFRQGPIRHNVALTMPSVRGDGPRHSVVREMWAHFQKNCGDDCSARKKQALARYQWVQAHNRRGGNYKVGINHMLDWTEDERFRLLGRRPLMLDEAKSKDVCGHWNKSLSELEMPLRFDWREHGEVVGPPRDQATCGSCWAFATIGMLEGQVAKKFGRRTRLSEQHIMDCSWSFGNLACDGGSDTSALSWLLQHNRGQVATADSYGQYLSENGFCHFDMSKGLQGLRGVAVAPPGSQKRTESGAALESCWRVPGADKNVVSRAIEYLTAALVTVGPISVSIQASQPDFYYYESGVYDNPACRSGNSDLDHSVLAVGYGRSTGPGQSYWVLRNSWSAMWGEGGFVRVAQDGNICGVATSPTFALLSDDPPRV